jgi:hypothetical protein
VGKNEIKPRKRRRSRRAGHDVSALVKRFLTELAAGESDAEHLKREERSLRGAFRVADPAA